MNTKIVNTMRQWLSHPGSVIAVILLYIILSFIDNNIGFFSAIGVALWVWSIFDRDWSLFGFGTRLSVRTVIYAILLTITVEFLMSWIIEPYLVHHFGELDLSNFDHIQGSLPNALFLFVVIWTFAAFGEEFLFKGYFMTWLARLLGDGQWAWAISAVFISIIFGISHHYQGMTGILSIIIIHLITSFVFIRHRDNLMIFVLAHGLGDTIGLIRLYYGYY